MARSICPVCARAVACLEDEETREMEEIEEKGGEREGDGGGRERDGGGEEEMEEE
jgi:hypothetical protein